MENRNTGCGSRTMPPEVDGQEFAQRESATLGKTRAANGLEQVRGRITVATDKVAQMIAALHRHQDALTGEPGPVVNSAGSKGMDDAQAVIDVFYRGGAIGELIDAIGVLEHNIDAMGAAIGRTINNGLVN